MIKNMKKKNLTVMVSNVDKFEAEYIISGVITPWTSFN